MNYSTKSVLLNTNGYILEQRLLVIQTYDQKAGSVKNTYSKHLVLICIPINK